MQRGVLQALNPLSDRVTFIAILPGAYQGRPKCAKNVLQEGWLPPTKRASAAKIN